MSEVTGSAVGATDPGLDSVWDRESLAAELDRLRRRAAHGTAARRISLQALSARCGVPRSTLHTYLTGASFPSASVLDLIVLALGCTPHEAADWSRAWERVCDSAFAGGVAPGAASAGRMHDLHQRVGEQMDRPTDGARHGLETIALFNRMHVDAERVGSSLEQRITVRATRPGVDRDFIRLQTAHNHRLGGFVVERTANCREGRHRTLTDPPVRLLEILFDHELEPGEVYAYEVTVRSPTPPDGDERATHALKGFDTRGPVFTLEVCFADGQHPSRVLQVRRPGYARSDEIIVREVPVSRWGAAQMSVERPVAGAYGLRWEWPD